MQILRNLSLSLAALLAAGLVLFYLSIMSSRYQSQWVYEAQSPTHLGSAIFYQMDGFMVTDFTFSVRDYALPNSKRVVINKWQDRSGYANWPERAYWSGDGSLLVIEWGEDQRDSPWSLIYDFRKHAEVTPKQSSGHMWKNTIKTLLANRGGKGQKIYTSQDDIMAKLRHVWWWEDFD